MRITALEAFGIDDRVIELWQSDGHHELLPVQETAVRDCGVLEGSNLLVFSPTSSGKTFVGEMAAIRTARQNRRAIYLVPQKALAEEKYNEFHARYGGFGIRTVISTRDRPEFDRAINLGQFHIAVIVFEKMQSLLVTSPGLLSNVGLVIVDELQMIGDRNRGPGLEILLTKMKLAEGNPQIIGLSAVLGKCEGMARWLGAELCKTDMRPVELRKGVLCDGVFQYIEHNSGQEGEEELAPLSRKRPVSPLVNQVTSFVGAGERCLVFCKSRQECVDTARDIAEGLDGTPAAGAIGELQDLEDSRCRERLLALLDSGVAYHNSDLDWDQRDIIERRFREGEIAVICATSTLALGINLPAKNVFIDPERYGKDAHGFWTRLPISQAEYENMSGRAGRLGLEREFGRAIIVTSSSFDAGTYLETYASGSLGDVQPALGEDPLAHHVLNLVASRLCRTDEEIAEMLLSSYTGELFWRGGEREDEFAVRLSEGVDHCIDGELIERDDDQLSATELGRLAAVKGISVDTAIRMAEFASTYCDVAEDLELLEVLACLTGTEDGERIYFQMATREHRGGEYQVLLDERLASLPLAARTRLLTTGDLSTREYEEAKRVKKTLLLHDWITDVPTREVEARFHCFTGSIAAIAREYAWLAEALGAIVRIYEWPEDVVEHILALSGQLAHGVSADGVNIAEARVRGLGRTRVKALVDQGLNSLEKIVRAPGEQLAKLLTRPVAERFFRRVKALLQRHTAEDAIEPQAAESLGHGQEADVVDWDEEFPPSDDLGTAYLSDVAVHIDGRGSNNMRHLVTLDGKEVWVRSASFEAILMLGIAAKKNELGWLPARSLGDPDNYYQIIRRLKQDLSADGIDIGGLIENNRAKQYRLSVPPNQVTIDADMIRRHFPTNAKFHSMLDELETGLTD